MTADDRIVGPSGLVLDLRRRLVTVHDVPVDLNRREVELLRVLLAERGSVVTFEELSRRAWGQEMGGDARFIYTTAWRLRRALDAAGATDVIESVRGIGYRIADSTPVTKSLEEFGLLHHDRPLVFFDPRDPSWRLVSANRSASVIAGDNIFAHADLLAFARNVTSAEDAARLEEGVRDALSSGWARVPEIRYARPDGTVLTLDMEFRRLDREGGSPLMLSEVVRVGQDPPLASPID